MREISVALNASVEDTFDMFPPPFRILVEEVRRQKLAGERRLPSAVLIDRSSLLTSSVRGKLLDAVAALVDENCTGRGDMCLQFAALLNKAQVHLEFPSRAVLGTAIYYDTQGKEIFRWEHAWVRIGNEVIDGNVDSTSENPRVPSAVSVAPYWGPVTETPRDRQLKEHHGMQLAPDVDVEETWWPDLRGWIDREMLS
ncbi:hypothetical protein HNQ77_004824 [Silvibacterium bohemicum]|uniref:Uncharacterized protein n=1 Tax=Silvibacterium bohemicum TaxID=1577686 RepID=A0A841JZD2_9BACT|nr:hypothetical protein [Silvibacterium bohemicum]MBB6146843.1 hypothetical protein [Silvibacterium bohemicum]